MEGEEEPSLPWLRMTDLQLQFKIVTQTSSKDLRIMFIRTVFLSSSSTSLTLSILGNLLETPQGQALAKAALQDHQKRLDVGAEEDRGCCVPSADEELHYQLRGDGLKKEGDRLPL
jgi:hypothetical protein